MLPEPKGCSASAIIGKKGALRVVEPSSCWAFLRCNSTQADVHQPEPRRETRLERLALGSASASQAESTAAAE